MRDQACWNNVRQTTTVPRRPTLLADDKTDEAGREGSKRPSGFDDQDMQAARPVRSENDRLFDIGGT